MKKEKPPKMTPEAKKWLKRRIEQRDKYNAARAKKLEEKKNE